MLDGQVPNHTASILTEILQWVRELSIIGFIAGAVWKLRGIWDDARDFLSSVKEHMANMDGFAKEVVTNHLTHIEKALEKLAVSDRDRETRETRDSRDTRDARES